MPDIMLVLDEWEASLFSFHLRNHFSHLDVKTWLFAYISATYYVSQRNQEPGQKRPKVHYEADFQTKRGANYGENMTADPAACNEAEVDDRATVVRELLPGLNAAGRQGRWGWRSHHPCEEDVFLGENIPHLFLCCCGLISSAWIN